jgi:anaphase-promoting complex subunit 2
MAWSVATRWLGLNREGFGTEGAFDLLRRERPAGRERPAEVEEALHYLLAGEGQSEDGREESLVEWYTSEVTLHFADVMTPVLNAQWQEVWVILPGGLRAPLTSGTGNRAG